MPMMNEDTMPMRERMRGGEMEPAETEDSSEEQASVFLPKSALGGKTVKAGDTVTLKVQDIDPETGDVEAVCTSCGPETSSKPGYEEAFDRAMPEETEE